MKRAIILLLLLTAAAAGQETVRKFVPLKHAHPDQVKELLHVFGREVRSQGNIPGVAISGPPEVVKAMEEMIARIDIPPAAPPVPNNIELTAYLLVGSEQGPAASVPAAIQPVINQIQSAFTYKSFRLLDTMMLRVREGDRGGASTTGAVELPDDSPGGTKKGTSGFVVGSVDIVEGSEGDLVRITNLRLDVTVPSGTLKSGEPRLVNTGVRTNVDVREGQKVVVGKANMAGAADQALILVLTAKVLD
jgi:hypothetical protein